MKILHTADWHIGNTFFGNDRNEEHRLFFDFLLRTIGEEHPDALVVAGDVFDTSNPSAEAQKIYYNFLHRATRENPGLQIVIIAGNHDSAGRIEAPGELLAADNIFVRGYMRNDTDGTPDINRMIIPLRGRENADDMAVCLAVPFLRSYELPEGKSFADSMARFFDTLAAEARHRYGKQMPMLLLAHFYATGSEIAAEDHSERIIIGGEESVDISSFCRKFDYVALGHIHKAQKIDGLENVRYAGSALPMSFSEKGYRHGVVCVEINNDDLITITDIPFDPPHPLMSIPARGALITDEALDAISRLPRAGKDTPPANYPYVEVKIDASEPDPTIPRKIRDMFEGKAAILCSIKRIEKSNIDYKELEIKTSEELRRLTPQSVAQTIYSKRYGGEKMPDTLLELLKQAEQAAITSSEEK